MRIISGKYKGRRFDKKLPAGIRPTTDSTKETVFNILSNLIDFDKLFICDVFAGSGGLGFECLSREAAFCTFVDKSGKSLRYIKEFAEELNIGKDTYECIKSDAMKFLGQEKDLKYDIFFIDPPYNLRIGDAIINKITDSGLLNKNGIIVAESSITDGIILPDNFEILHHKIFGSTQVHFMSEKE
jgi:16S rRNA (guanine(966)-N(2))-methyltransferase RsmD